MSNCTKINIRNRPKKQDIMTKKLTPTIRATYEGHKSATRKAPKAQVDLTQAGAHLDQLGIYKVKTPEEYVKVISIDESIPLGKFLEKIITLGSSQGFVAFMMLYQYMYDKNLLGKEIEKLTGQEIIDHMYQENSYRLKPKDKQAFLCSIIQLSGIQFCIESWELTQKIRNERGFENDIGFKHFTLVKIGGHTKSPDSASVTSIRSVSIMKDFINVWYKKLSRLLIPLEDILKIPSDRNGDHKRGFNLSLALRHAELGPKRSYVEWNLEQCLNVGQWKFTQRRKTQAWKTIIDSLEAGKRQELIDYKLIHASYKPEEPRYIEKVLIYRLWETGTESLTLEFNPEEIKPKQKRIKSDWD